jgi:hypothetical protein
MINSSSIGKTKERSRNPRESDPSYWTNEKASETVHLAFGMMYLKSLHQSMGCVRRISSYFGTRPLSQIFSTAYSTRAVRILR